MSTTVDTTAEIRSFRIEVPEEQLADLRRRIAATRWPTKELVADRSQGVQLATLQELARYWTSEYDWRKCEARLNALPQFTTEIDGVEIHFIHVRSRHENALPLIMMHGWPGSVIELLETVGPLTDPTAHGGTAEDAFHLVLPSLPGYGFSGEPAELGWESGRTARAWAELMHRLGYTRYVAQGGDVGALVTDLMGRQAVEGLVGYHLNLLTAVLAIGDQLPRESEQERAAAEAARDIQAGRLRLLPRDGNAAADDQLLPAGFTRRAGGLAARSRHGQLLQDRRRLRRRKALPHRAADPGRLRRQARAVATRLRRRRGCCHRRDPARPVDVVGRGCLCTDAGAGRLRFGLQVAAAPGRVHQDLQEPVRPGQRYPSARGHRGGRPASAVGARLAGELVRLAVPDTGAGEGLHRHCPPTSGESG